MVQAQDKDPYRSMTFTGLAPFYHGVASGDPLSDAVIIWTRVTTSDSIAEVTWRIALDTAMSSVVDSGIVSTDNLKDFTVKVDVTNLAPNTFYYYEFEYQGLYSIRGRTKTAPVGDIDNIRFAVVSCASYAHGYFNAYDRIRERNDVNAVIHLGDYYYEYGDGEYGSVRNYDPSTEIITISDYRMRLSQYRLDASLMRLHQQYPFICVWDDHETANNSWYGGAQNHDTGEGSWFNRKAEAIKAYFEWMPVRMPDPAIDTQRIYRSFRYGDLAELQMLDTRLQGREEQGFDNTSTPGRTILGADQFDWLCEHMDTSKAQWQILGQQVMMAPLDANILGFGGPLYPNDDQWDAYADERNRLYDSIFANSIQNVVVLTGDIHTSWANDLPTATYVGSTGAGSAGVEFVVTSVTSPALDALGALGGVATGLIQNVNEHMKYIDLTQKGYYVLDITKQRTQADWYYVDRVDQLDSNETWGSSWKTDDLSRHLSTAMGASVADSSLIGIPAPDDPRTYTVSVNNIPSHATNTLVSIHPNPFIDGLNMQFTMAKADEVKLSLFDLGGRLLANKDLGYMAAGIHNAEFSIRNLVPGNYVLKLQLGDDIQSRVVIKK